MKVLIATMALGLAATPICAAPRSSYDPFLAKVQKAIEACPNPADKRTPACLRRVKLSDEARRRGWCWGPDNGPQYDHALIRCDPKDGSIIYSSN